MIEIETECVRDFLRAILPTEPHFAGTPTYFRGQASTDWRLVPSLWRAASWARLGGAVQHGLRLVGGQVEDGTSKVRDRGRAILFTLQRVLRRGHFPMPESDHALEALAQHIGLPSRFLDWTRSPFVAAYFAAADVIRLPLSGGRLVVYAMSELYAQSSLRLEDQAKPDVAGAGNPNLVAQQGRFVLVDRDPPDLLDGVERVKRPNGVRLPLLENRAVENHFTAITLSHTHAPRLLRTLRDQGIHAATLFPGHLGVAELVREVFIAPDGTTPASGDPAP